MHLQNIGFPARKCTSLTAQVGREQKCANALETKNIHFPVGKYTFLETEEGLDVVWERKVLVFLQEDAHF